MPLRSFRERVLQTVLYEAGGILIAAPLYALLFGAGPAESVTLMVALSVIVLVWVPVFNTLFDLVEWRWTRRPASDRPHRLRLVHAVALETGSIVATLPAIMLIGGHGFWEALTIDIGLSILYAGYAYVFHYLCDRLRPLDP